MTAKVELLTPSGGKVILDPTNTAVDRVLTLPAVAGTVLNTASDIEAQVKTATSATGSAPIFSCRAWVNFNGNLATLEIRGSGNVSSVTDQNIGTYSVNFTNEMPDANYVVSATPGLTKNRGVAAAQNLSTTAVQILTSDGNTGAQYDSTIVHVAVFR